MSKKNKKQKEREKLDRARDEKCVPIAKEVLKLIAGADLSLSPDQSFDENLAEYKPLTDAIFDLYLKEDLKLSDVSYVKRLILEIIDNVDQIVINLTNKSLKIVDTRLWGVEKEEMTYGYLDKKLIETNPKD